MCAWHAKKILKSALQICVARTTLGTATSIPCTFAFTRLFIYLFISSQQSHRHLLSTFFFAPAVEKRRADGGSRFK